LCIQGTAQLVLTIVDDLLPRVTLYFLFGETTVICESRFSVDELPAEREKAIGMMLASADPSAHLSINDELVLGIVLPPAPIMSVVPVGVQFVTPDMHPYIVDVLEDDQVAFSVGHYRWEIGMMFLFGDTTLQFSSSFASHLVPAALNRAKDIASTAIDPHYYFEQLFQPNANYHHFQI
jgi:hypothetical protein